MGKRFEEVQLEQFEELLGDLRAASPRFLRTARLIREELGEKEDSYAVTKLALIHLVLSTYAPPPASSYYKAYRRTVRRLL